MTTALFVDTYSRNVSVHTVSVTEVPGRGLVMRYAAEVGSLYLLTQKSELKNEDLPILVATRGYSAQSSAGFVDVVSEGHRQVKKQVVGFQGMPWQRSGGLYVASRPMEVLALRPGTNIMKVATHSSGRRGHSNPATAEAAIVGLKIKAKAEPNSVFILEGQSDYAQAWKLAAYYTAYEEEWVPEFPTEHRMDRFTDEAMALAYVRHMDASRQVFSLALGAVSAQVAEKDRWHWVQEFVRPSVGLEWNQWTTFQTGAPAALRRLLEGKYSFRVVPQGNQTCVEVSSPEGEETYTLDLGPEGITSHYVVESILLEMASNTDEEKVQMRYDRRADLLNKSLTRPLRENAEEYKVHSFNKFQSATSYRLVPASWTHYQSSDNWEYGSPRDVEPLEAETAENVLNDPSFAEVANKANTIFFVAYDEDGIAVAAKHVEWGFDFDFGWQGIQSHGAMLKALSIKS